MNRFLFPILALLIMSLLVGCIARYPLGMTEEQWLTLTPEQQHEARMKQAEIDEARRKAREAEQARKAEEERRQAELRRQQEARQHEEDLKNGLLARHTQKVCIGGPACSGYQSNEYVMSFPQAYVDYVVFSADDYIGKKHGAKLSLYADNVRLVQGIDIKKKGSTHQFRIDRVATSITLKAEHEDEANIHWMKIFGRKGYGHGGGKTIIIIQ